MIESGLREDVHDVTRSRREEIEKRAYEIYMSRGCDQGDALADWLQVERELSEQRTPTMMPDVSESKKPTSAMRRSATRR
jgi:hypothetical protein